MAVAMETVQANIRRLVLHIAIRTQETSRLSGE
jgi:hypothetical protein